MTGQSTLFHTVGDPDGGKARLVPASAPPSPEPETLDERFARFHAGHPEVYRKLVALARRMKARGFETYSIKTLAEVVRWHSDAHGTDAEGFRINNSYTSRYARLIMDENPDLDGFFVTRELQGGGEA